VKLIHNNQTIKRKNNDFCWATEYPLHCKDIDGCIIELSGRYPSEGRVFNEKCKELFFVLDGKGKLSIEGKDISIKKGDLALIEVGEKYYWEGKLKMFVTCSPAWYPEQHKTIGL
jgi:mannose-6-phosphate isomerase-like protein (cupin superfamily)